MTLDTQKTYHAHGDMRWNLIWPNDMRPSVYLATVVLTVRRYR
jgi:hypothetical protein